MDSLFRFITKINYSKITTKKFKFINDFFTSNILYLYRFFFFWINLYLYSYFYVKANILKVDKRIFLLEKKYYSF